MDMTEQLQAAFRRGVEVREFLKPIIGSGEVTVLGDGAVFVEGQVRGEGVRFPAPLVDAILEGNAAACDTLGECDDCGSPARRHRGDGDLSEMAVQHTNGLGGTGMFAVANGMFKQGPEMTESDGAVEDESYGSVTSILIEVALALEPMRRKQLARIVRRKRLKSTLAGMEEAGMVRKSGKTWHLVEPEDEDADGAVASRYLVSCVMHKDDAGKELMTHFMFQTDAPSEDGARQAAILHARAEHPGYAMTSMLVHVVGDGEDSDAAG